MEDSIHQLKGTHSMNSIRPTVGRVVWYHPDKNSATGGFQQNGEQPFAAVVAYVWGETAVNLTVFDHSGNAHSRTSVILVQPGSTPPEHGHWCEWMPYQIGQAARTQQAEAQADSRAMAATGG